MAIIIRILIAIIILCIIATTLYVLCVAPTRLTHHTTTTRTYITVNNSKHQIRTQPTHLLAIAKLY